MSFKVLKTPPTLSHGFNGDDLAGISTTRGGDGHHPDAVLSVPAQVGDAVEEHIWGGLKLTAHLRTRDRGRKSENDRKTLHFRFQPVS